MMSKSIRAPIGQECHSTTSFKCQLRLHFYILDRIRVYNKAKECDPVFPLYEIHVGRDPPWPLRLNACISPEQIHWPPKTTAPMVLRSSRLLLYIFTAESPSQATQPCTIDADLVSFQSCTWFWRKTYFPRRVSLTRKDTNQPPCELPARYTSAVRNIYTNQCFSWKLTSGSRRAFSEGFCSVSICFFAKL